VVNFEKEAKLQVIFSLAPIIVGLIAAIILLPNYIGQSDKARVRAAHAQIQQLATALDSYKRDVGSFPSTEQGLQALRVKPQGVSGWDGPYLSKDIPNDPWGHPYIYKFPGKSPDKPEIVSYGADGAPGGEGYNADIISE
jgi:general secretion pathway protein G